jgi:hypothetical protein
MINCFQFCLNFAFKYNLRRYNKAAKKKPAGKSGGRKVGWRTLKPVLKAPGGSA